MPTSHNISTPETPWNSQGAAQQAAATETANPGIPEWVAMTALLPYQHSVACRDYFPRVNGKPGSLAESCRIDRDKKDHFVAQRFLFALLSVS